MRTCARQIHACSSRGVRRWTFCVSPKRSRCCAASESISFGTISCIRRRGVFGMSRNSASSLQLSVVVPLFNEVATLDELHRRLTAVLFIAGPASEIVSVDDGSSYGTRYEHDSLVARFSHFRVISLARNYGQTSALAAGFDAAAGEIIVAMDGDLQHAPEEIPKLLAKLDDGYDIVSGWREQRVDNLWTRRLPSRIANWMMARL